MENITSITDTTSTQDQGITKVHGRVWQGTVKDFVENGLKVNGKFIDTVGLSVMGKYGIVKAVSQRKPQRGKPAAVYEIDFDQQTMFSM